MQKRIVVKKIKKIINEWGSFHLGEVEGAEGICVNQMGGLIGLAEYFNEHSAEINVYDTHSSNCNEIHTYEERYNNLPKEALEEILYLAEMWEDENIKTEKRISD